MESFMYEDVTVDPKCIKNQGDIFHILKIDLIECLQVT